MLAAPAAAALRLGTVSENSEVLVVHTANEFYGTFVSTSSPRWTCRTRLSRECCMGQPYASNNNPGAQ